MRRSFDDMATEQLIEFYVFLNREWEDEESKRTASKLIKQTLRKRFKATVDMLDDDQVKKNPQGLFKNILLGVYQKGTI